MKAFLAILSVLLFLAILSLSLFYADKETWIGGRIKMDLKKLTGHEISYLEPITVKNKYSQGIYMRVEIPRISILNPSGFKGEAHLAEVRNVQLEFDALKFLMGHWDIRILQGHLETIILEQDKNGNFNFSRLSALQIREKDEEYPSGFLIRKLELSFGESTYKFRPEGDNKNTGTLKFAGEREIYENVTDPRILIQSPVLKIINKLNKGSLGLDLVRIQKNIAKQTRNQ